MKKEIPSPYGKKSFLIEIDEKRDLLLNIVFQIVAQECNELLLENIKFHKLEKTVEDFASEMAVHVHNAGMCADKNCKCNKNGL